MTDARDAFAKRLHGREYLAEMTLAEEAEAKAARLLVVFGASDDLTEFRGIICDEAGASDEYGHRVAQVRGAWAIAEPTEDRYGRRIEPKGVLIKTKRCPPGLETSWLIKPSVPHATFNIMEGDGIYCIGAVIDEADLLPRDRVLSVHKHPQDWSVVAVTFSFPVSGDDMRSIEAHLKEWSR